MEKSNIQRKWKVIRFILFLSFLGLLFLNNSIALLDINNLPQERDDAVLVTTENRQKDLIFTINDPLTLLLERAWNIFIHPQNHPVRNTITWLITIAFVAIFGFYQARKSFTQFSILNSITAGLMSFIIIFTFSHCGAVTGGDKKGNPIWLSNQNGVTSNTQSVSNSGGSGSGQSSLSNGVVPVKGMYFLHPDHLGSISMITDGHGNVVSGGTFGGKSNIVYKPYGEIDREKSSGPDITRYKYTGQEEDKETGLYYYKARYYDPMVGRFLQADSISDGNNIFGQNLYMYVNGNPMKYSDPDGKRACGARTNGTIALLLTENPFYSAASGVAPGHNYTGNGSCASNQPRWEYAYLALFSNYYNDSNVSDQDKLALLYATNLYVKEGKRTGRGTFLDGINIHRKEYSNLLIAGVLTGNLKPEQAIIVYNLMTRNGTVPEPRNGIDRGSYLHDFSDGSGPLRRKARRANSEWIKNAWSNVNNPYDFVMAGTGTILFGTANFMSGLPMIKIKPPRVKVTGGSGNFIGR